MSQILNMNVQIRGLFSSGSLRIFCMASILSSVARMRYGM